MRMVFSNRSRSRSSFHCRAALRLAFTNTAQAAPLGGASLGVSPIQASSRRPGTPSRHKLGPGRNEYCSALRAISFN